jgi:hypothetical protein
MLNKNIPQKGLNFGIPNQQILENNIINDFPNKTELNQPINNNLEFQKNIVELVHGTKQHDFIHNKRNELLNTA